MDSIGFVSIVNARVTEIESYH